MKKLLIMLLVMPVLAAIILPNLPGPHRQASANSTETKVAPEVMEALAGESKKAAALSKQERNELIAKVTKGFKVERDKMEAVTFYTAKGTNVMGMRFDPYLSIPDGRAAIFRMVAQYSSDDWVFFQRVKVMADDEIVYEKEFKYGDVVRDNASGTVWETIDYAAGPTDLAAIERIADAKKVTIRFSGKERRSDYDLSKGQLERLRTSLKAFKELAPLRT